MNWIDIACAACLLVFSVIGLWRGLLSSVFKLCGWIAAIFGAYFAQDLLGDFFVRNFAFGDFADLYRFLNTVPAIFVYWAYCRRFHQGYNCR